MNITGSSLNDYDIILETQSNTANIDLSPTLGTISENSGLKIFNANNVLMLKKMKSESAVSELIGAILLVSLVVSADDGSYNGYTLVVLARRKFLN